MDYLETKNMNNYYLNHNFFCGLLIDFLTFETQIYSCNFMLFFRKLSHNGQNRNIMINKPDMKIKQFLKIELHSFGQKISFYFNY